MLFRQFQRLYGLIGRDEIDTCLDERIDVVEVIDRPDVHHETEVVALLDPFGVQGEDGVLIVDAAEPFSLDRLRIPVAIEVLDRNVGVSLQND